ncbi:hypothetical protein KSP39_PZI023153 [Platanthera zijinensis]|uniref:CCHC-type domain-containing protein n=1 Tax=Platanthera zijinensis TaxID=2320716 RepID=A0AAP0AW11_9ASPA
MRCPEDRKVELASFLLEGAAKRWWNNIVATKFIRREQVTWTNFLHEFTNCLVPRSEKRVLHDQFLRLVQGTKSVLQYEAEFSKLAYYADSLVTTEEDRCRQFQQGLQDDIRNLLVPLDILEYGKLVERARLVEIDQGKSQKARDSGKRKVTETPTQNEVQGSRDSKALQLAPSTNTTTQVTATKCAKCGRFHRGECLIGACYYCRQPGHTKRNCPKLLSKASSTQGPSPQLYQMTTESLASTPTPAPVPLAPSAPV